MGFTVAPLAQRIERPVPSREVTGSIPVRGTSLSSNREDAALSQRRCGFESRRGYVHAWRFVACVMVTFGSYLFCTAWAGFGFSSLLPTLIPGRVLRL